MEIQSLRRLVRQGRYEVPPERVAQAIIEWIDPRALEGGLTPPTPTTPVSGRRAFVDRRLPRS